MKTVKHNHPFSPLRSNTADDSSRDQCCISGDSTICALFVERRRPKSSQSRKYVPCVDTQLTTHTPERTNCRLPVHGQVACRHLKKYLLLNSVFPQRFSLALHADTCNAHPAARLMRRRRRRAVLSATPRQASSTRVRRSPSRWPARPSATAKRR